MSKKDAKNVISSYRKKQKTGPYILGGLAILLVVVGIVLLVVYLVGGGGGLQLAFLNTSTPTPTETPPPTPVTPNGNLHDDAYRDEHTYGNGHQHALRTGRI
jgi:hypothetical protein